MIITATEKIKLLFEKNIYIILPFLMIAELTTGAESTKFTKLMHNGHTSSVLNNNLSADILTAQ